MKPDIYSIENGVDPDLKKQTDQDPYCFLYNIQVHKVLPH